MSLPSYNDLFCRNIGIVSQKEQEILEESTVAIAGVGGDGGLIAETLARSGIGHIKIADPGTFESSNINRQNGCFIDALGENKARVIESIIKRINPYCKVEIFDEGVNKYNANDFVNGSDIVIDESEFTVHEVAVILAREARKQQVPLITGLNIGFGSIVLAFTPESLAFEKYLGLPAKMTIEEISSIKVPISKWCPRLPCYINAQVLGDIEAGKMEVPGISPSVALTSAIVSTEALLFLLKRKRLVVAPRYIWIDLYNKGLKIRRANRASFWFSLLLMSFNTLVKGKLQISEAGRQFKG